MEAALYGPGRAAQTMTKNGSTREIPMSRTCQQSFEVLRALGRHEGRSFQSKHGKAVNNPRKWFELALEEAEIKNFLWHDLRHTFVSRLAMKDVNLRTVQELSGHKTISMTTRHAHHAPAHNQTAVESLDPGAA
jgi:integrase